jgi:hypothetical protein
MQHNTADRSRRYPGTGGVVRQCARGNKKWFDPLANDHHAELGVAVENAFSGASLGPKWSDPNKRSAFFGTFDY